MDLNLAQMHLALQIQQNVLTVISPMVFYQELMQNVSQINPNVLLDTMGMDLLVGQMQSVSKVSLNASPITSVMEVE